MSRQRKRYDRLAKIAGLKMKRRGITQYRPYQILNIDGEFVFLLRVSFNEIQCLLYYQLLNNREGGSYR